MNDNKPAVPYVEVKRDSVGSFDIYLFDENGELKRTDYNLTRFFAVLKGRRMLRRYLRGDMLPETFTITPSDL